MNTRSTILVSAALWLSQIVAFDLSEAQAQKRPYAAETAVSAPTADGGSPGPSDPWAELIRAAQKEESITSRVELAELEKTRERGFSVRKQRGVLGVIYGGFGFDAVLFHSPFIVKISEYSSGYQLDDVFLGGLLTAGAGLRYPLSFHWELQSRVTLGLGVGSYDSSASHTLFSLSGDLTFRARGGGLSGRAGYFGMGVMVSGRFALLQIEPRYGNATGTMALGYGGGILEAGGVWGRREQWELGLRWMFAGGAWFANELSLVFGGVIGQSGRTGD